MARARGPCFICMRWILLAAIAISACGTARPRPRPAEARVPDAIPEKVAVKRHTDPKLQAEDEERRWGMEQKRQRDLEQRRRARQKAESTQNADVSKQSAPPKK
jgi:hypothetical protein